jgi:hypothetical protein
MFVAGGRLWVGVATSDSVLKSPHPGPLPKGARGKIAQSDPFAVKGEAEKSAPSDPLSPLGRGLG